jgi:hypothetical protein
MIRINCPECIKKAEGFLLKAGLSADCLHWQKDSRGDLILARDTTVVLDGTWRQERRHHKRPAIWKESHRIKLVDADQHTYHGSRTAIWHLAVRNFDHQQANLVLWCDAPDCFSLAGPGAEAQIAADAEAVAARNAKEHYAAFEAARTEANKTETDGFCRQLQAAFQALGFDVSARSDFTRRRASGISMSPENAAKIVAALGGIAPPRPVEPMPVWSVRYGENPDDDKEPMLVGARTEAAVRAHMLANYCDERRDDGPNVPLDPAKLHIEPVPVPEKPPEDEAA